ncbi:purine-binding chemotaxis protein CheW [Desulfobulbus rhabdoformis]|uniref:chemotaxis protein CheW n=1 Tax=Desulfobulbus rhabdoformis TaxID=34032 RepID=UPI0019658928|nr:chemotaxis protein CheW [Desulfobulbus rhabdoformis]MBM9614119.1 purine-binding chemotaxis protein CheW [Desulfobulbus rhabdoformis]
MGLLIFNLGYTLKIGLWTGEQVVEVNAKVLTFQLDERLYAVPVAELLEVVRPVTLYPVNKAEPYVLGMINYHGVSTPVLDVKRLLALDETARVEPQAWLAVRAENMLVCLCVDQLSQLYRIAPENLDAVPVLIRNENTDYIKQYLRLGQEVVPLIDLQELLVHKMTEIETLMAS